MPQADSQPVTPLPITPELPAAQPAVPETAAALPPVQPEIVVLGGSLERQNKQMQALDRVLTRVRRIYLLVLIIAIAALVGTSMALQLVLN